VVSALLLVHAGLLGASQRPAAPGAPAAGDQLSALSGVVVDGHTSRPIAGAVVVLTGTQYTQATTADDRGRFVLPGIPEGTYNVGAQKLPYFPGLYGSEFAGLQPWNPLLVISGMDETGNLPRHVRLGPREWLQDLRIALWRPGSISGVVLDESGEPLVGRAIRALNLKPFAGNAALSVIDATVTDDRGLYSLSRLPKGQYVVAALPYERSELSGGREAALHPTTFYPDARTLSTAIPVDVDFGGELVGVDFRLKAVGVHTVSGRVEGPRESLGSVRLRMLGATDPDLGASAELGGTYPDNVGRFEFGNVPTGDYVIVTLPSTNESPAFARLHGGPDWWSLPGVPVGQPFTDGRTYWSRTSVSVREQNVEDVTVRLVPTATVSGRIRLEPVDGHEALRLPSLSGEPAPDNPFHRASLIGRPAADGTFAFSGFIAGRYYVRSSGSQVIKSVLAGGQNVTDRPIDVSGADIENVVVTITHGGRLRGTVRRDPDRTAPGTRVVYFPSDRSEWAHVTPRSPRAGVIPVDSSGVYDSRAVLPAGEYFVVAVSDLPIGTWRTLSFFGSAAALATTARIEWGGVREQALAVQEIRWP
jgi:hypothetical protein